MSFNLGRTLLSCAFVAIAQLVLIPQATAGTCGVLPFTHGADITVGAASNITSLVSTELDFRGPWTIVITASKQEITDGCGGDQSCLMAFGKGEAHDGVVTGTITAQGSDKYRITARWYEVGTGRMKREVTQDISRTADLLIEEVPGFVTHLLTGKAPASRKETEEKKKSQRFASLNEIDFDDLDEDEEEEEEAPRVRQRAKPKRDNRGRLREPVEEDGDDPFGLDLDDLDDLDEIERKNDRQRRAAVERAAREMEQRRAREEERRRAERIAEEQRAEEEAETRARADRRERERRAREQAEREREEEERQARADRQRHERDAEERAERARLAQERRDAVERAERERVVEERRERRDAEALAKEREREERDRIADERNQRRAEERREAEDRRAADRRADDRRADDRRADDRRERAEAERLAAAEADEEDEEDEEVDYADVQLGSALAAGAISFAMEDADEDDGYSSFSMEDADEDEDGYSSISMEDADDEPQVGDLVTDRGYSDPGARRRAAAAARRSDRDDRYSRARNFGSRASDEDDDDASRDEDEDLDLDDGRLASRYTSSRDRRGSRRDYDDDRDERTSRSDGTYRYIPRGRDDDDLDDDREALNSRRSTSGRATAMATTSDPGARRHISIRGSGGLSHYYLFFGQYGLDIGIFPVDALSIDIGAEGWSLSLTEQAEDEAGNLLWEDNGEPVTQTELRTLPHFTVGASWRADFHRVVKPYAGGDVGAIMYATERHTDGTTTPRFGVTGMFKGGVDIMFTRIVGAHIGGRVGVAYSPMVEELVFLEWSPVTFVANFRAGLTLAF
jgi:hypothetical protein